MFVVLMSATGAEIWPRIDARLFVSLESCPPATLSRYLDPFFVRERPIDMVALAPGGGRNSDDSRSRYRRRCVSRLCCKIGDHSASVDLDLGQDGAIELSFRLPFKKIRFKLGTRGLAAGSVDIEGKPWSVTGTDAQIRCPESFLGSCGCTVKAKWPLRSGPKGGEAVVGSTGCPTLEWSS